MSADLMLDPEVSEAQRIREGRLVHAQCVILGCVMEDPAAIDRLPGIERRSFPEPWYGRLFEHLSERIAAGEAVEPYLLQHVLPADWLQAGGGLQTLVALRDHASPRLLSLAVAELQAYAVERRMVQALDEARGVLAEDKPLPDRLDRIATLVTGVERTQSDRAGPRRLADVVLERTAHYEALEEGKAKPGMSLGIHALDSMLGGGLRAGGVYVLAARPGIGKSSLAQQFAIHVARMGHVVLMLSQEMPAGELADRAIANVAGVDYGALSEGRTRESWGAILDAQEELAGLPLWVDDEEALTVHKVRAKARAIKGLHVLVVDYLQLMQGSGKSDANRNAEIEVISRGLKALAKQLGIAVVLLSQLNRQVEQRVSKRPTCADLRDSGSIEQDADVVLLMWQHREMPGGQRVIGCRIDKNRQGRKGDVALHFDGPRQRWGESTESLEQAAPSRGGRNEDSL